MPFLRGEDVNIGVGREAVRGTPVAMGVFIPGRTPAGIVAQLEKVAVRETRGTKMPSQGSETVQKRAGGSLEFNLRNSSIGYLLLSLLGSVSSALKGGESAVYNHTFSLLASNPQHPSLTLGLSQPGIQDYEYPLSLVKSLEIRTPVDDLVNATAEFISSKEQEKTPAYSPTFASNDYYFRHQDITIKLASTLAGLGAASAIKVKDFSMTIDNGARVNQNVSEINPSDVLATIITISGSIELDQLNKTHHDSFVNGTYQALRLTLARTDVTIGTSSNPTLQIDLPKVSFESFDPNRAIDDIVSEKINFTAHYSISDASGIVCVLTNEKANYTT